MDTVPDTVTTAAMVGGIMADMHQLTTVGMRRHTTATAIDRPTTTDIGECIIGLPTLTTTDRGTMADGTTITGGIGTTGENHSCRTNCSNGSLPQVPLSLASAPSRPKPQRGSSLVILSEVCRGGDL